MFDAICFYVPLGSVGVFMVECPWPPWLPMSRCTWRLKVSSKQQVITSRAPRPIQSAVCRTSLESACLYERVHTHPAPRLRVSRPSVTWARPWSGWRSMRRPIPLHIECSTKKIDTHLRFLPSSISPIQASWPQPITTANSYRIGPRPSHGVHGHYWPIHDSLASQSDSPKSPFSLAQESIFSILPLNSGCGPPRTMAIRR